MRHRRWSLEGRAAAAAAGTIVMLTALIGFGPTAPALGQDPIGWEVRSGDAAACDANPVQAGVEPQGIPVLTRNDVICLSAESGAQIGEQLDEQLAIDGDTIAIAEDWAFDASELGAGEVLATFGPPDETSGSRPFGVLIQPDIGLSIDWDTPAGGVIDPLADGSEGDVGTSADESSSADEEGAGSLVVEPASAQRIGLGGVDKLISVTGLDAAAVAEAALAGQVRVVDDVPAGAVASALPLDAERRDAMVILPLPGTGSVAYRLMASGADTAQAEPRALRTRLLIGETELAAVPFAAVVEPPPVTIELVTGDFDDGVFGATVRVTNSGAEAIAGPVTIRLSPADTTNFVGFRDASDEWAVSDGDTLIWVLPDGLPGASETVERRATVAMARGRTDTVVEWRAEVLGPPTGDGEPLVLDTASASVAVPAGDSGDDGSTVDFRPDQLIQLIAFVVLLALIGIVLGAIIRRNRVMRANTGTDPVLEREHEEAIFRQYAQTIVVIVILVSILVMTLRGSLEAESAASLIGVIAGYALGQRGR